MEGLLVKCAVKALDDSIVCYPIFFSGAVTRICSRVFPSSLGIPAVMRYSRHRLGASKVTAYSRLTVSIDTRR